MAEKCKVLSQPFIRRLMLRILGLGILIPMICIQSDKLMSLYNFEDIPDSPYKLMTLIFSHNHLAIKDNFL